MALFDLCSPTSNFPFGLISAVIQLLVIAILFRAILSWFVRDPNNPIARALDTITEPILQPMRQIVPRMGMLDITPLIALVLLSFIARVLCG